MDTENALVFATRNRDKRREFEHLLEGDFLDPGWVTYDIESWSEPIPEIEEDGDTFRTNAFKKAETVSLETSATALADDSGLEVDALNGKPGVHSARFAGPNATDEENNRKLIEQLQGVPESDRTARFVCVVALVLTGELVGRALTDRTGIPFEDVPPSRPRGEGRLARVDDRVYAWFRGTVEGRIVDEPRGDRGFGYDPHFYLPERDKTMAELPLETKNEISHRAAAARKMEDFFSRP
jgi:XTP/dITP diphosphohydrolase